MKEKLYTGIIGGITVIRDITTISSPLYSYYILPVVRHKELMDKIDGFDKRLHLCAFKTPTFKYINI